MPANETADIHTRASTGQACTPDFVYTIFIKADVEAVWNGLIDRDLTKAYWGHYNESDWKPGSRWAHVRSDGSGEIDICGRLVAIEPPHTMIWTWSLEREADNPACISRVTYELTPLGPDTKLTVTHSELEPDPGWIMECGKDGQPCSATSSHYWKPGPCCPRNYGKNLASA
ncbi:polyketide cyclase [Sphingopyxis sp. BSNA05]|uniref:SRPBCC domain-containing protein n=1 Tax=Sphingopyxis sp. BSNA05 TaxID=1236614 RepID=UPI001565CD53|nr:SRPBCC domain-containing protein [Sphingopyxis sp. BSNA05]NRD90994.1 polyketide cyclase [Sphingopyxis sp. BSNA05]